MKIIPFKLFENNIPYNYYSLIDDLYKENFEKYKESRFPVLKMMVNPLPDNVKERKFLDSFVEKISNNKIIHDRYVTPILMKMKNVIPSVLSNILSSENGRTFTKETLEYLYNNRHIIYTEQVMNNIFKKLFLLSATSLISERSMTEFLEKNGYTILKTSTNDDIHKGIDITSTKGESKLTFQVKSILHDENIKISENNEYIDIKTSLDLLHTAELKYDYISFVTPSRIITAPRKTLNITKKNGGFIIKSPNIQSRNYVTNYSDKKTNTFLDNIFLK